MTALFHVYKMYIFGTKNCLDYKVRVFGLEVGIRFYCMYIIDITHQIRTSLYDLPDLTKLKPGKNRN